MSFQCPPDAPKIRRAAENDLLENTFHQVNQMKVSKGFYANTVLKLVTLPTLTVSTFLFETVCGIQGSVGIQLKA